MANIARTAAPHIQHDHLKSGRARASFSGAAWSALNTGISTLAAALLFYVSSRFLGPEEFGLVAIATSVVTIASAFAPVAFGEALVQKGDMRSQHVHTVFTTCLVMGCLLYVVMWSVAPAIARWLQEPAVAMLIPLIGIRLAFEMLAVVPNALITRKMQYKMIALRTALANLAAAVICVTLLFMGFGLWALAFAQVTNVAVAAIVVLVVSGWRPRISFNAKAFRELRSYGLFASGTRALNILRLDQLLIGAMGGAALAGIFNFSNRLFQMLNGLVSGAFGSVSHALMSSLQSERDKVREAFFIALFGSSLVAFPIFIGLILIADPAIPLIFGDKWENAVVPVQAFSVIGVLAAIGVVQGSLITSQGRANWWFWYQCVMQISNLPLIFLFMPWGLDSVLIAIAVKTILLWPISVFMSIRLLESRIYDYALSLYVPLFSSLVMAVSVLAIPHLASDMSRGLVLLLQVSVGMVVYMVAAFVLGRKQITRILNRLKNHRERK